MPAPPERARAEISAVLPTFNRVGALRANLEALLELEDVGEVIVVDDGSTDGTDEYLRALGRPRLHVVRLPANRGTPTARNAGVRRARGAWVLFGEDDCRFPPEFARVLRDEAQAHGADVVGAPMVHPRPGEPVEAAVAAARDGGAASTGGTRRFTGSGRRPPRLGGARRGIDELPGFPPAPVVTPLLQAPSLVRRSLAERLRFDERYRGNAYREETDFFVRAARAGALCLLTPRTYFWEPARWPGGQSARPALASELWTVRNNWRFLRRHGRWLAEAGLIRSPAAEQAAFLLRRARKLADRVGE